MEFTIKEKLGVSCMHGACILLYVNLCNQYKSILAC